MELTRRDFMRSVSGATLALCLDRLAFLQAGGTAPALAAALSPEYAHWEDVYRQQWTWDRVAKGTHHINCWYQRGCNWNVYVRDGIVWREEQVAAYPQTNPEVPDFNPRGCQKGACYSHRMYEPGRVRYPLKRVGKRGEGTWQRVRWDEALNDIADRVIDVLRTDGPGAIYWDPGGASTSGGNGVGLMRTSRLLDTIVLNLDGEVGDHHPGAQVTCGKIEFSSSADDLFYSDLILVWGGNPVYTQIPNAHFLLEARYHGAHLVTIAPDVNPSAMHADLWVPVQIGTDAALALSMAQVIVAEKLHDEAFIREQTDLPFLVRTDTRRFLRASDVEEGGNDDRFYVWDLASKQLQAASPNTLALGPVVPALDGEHEVKTRDGAVRVTPAFSLLRERLQHYTPEAAAAVTGTHPDLVRRLARQIAHAKAATVITQSNFSKFYHGVEMERAQILLLALCGQFGKKGSGVNAFPWLSVDAGNAAIVAPPLPLKLGAAAVADVQEPALRQALAEGRTTEMFTYEALRHEYGKGGSVAGLLFYHRFGGLAPLTGSSRRWDPHLKRELDAYLTEAVQKGWQLDPKLEPKILFEAGGNILRRTRGYDRLLEGLLPRLSLFVTIDFRMSHTALHSDYVLPAAGWYERDDLTYATPIAPFTHVTTKATEPVGEAKSEWAIHCLLMKAIQDRAIARGLTTFADRSGAERRLDQVHDQLTFGQQYTEENVEAFLGALMEINSNLDGVTWEKLKKDGCARFTSVGTGFGIGNATDIKPDETITANTWHTDKKMPWPTLTRRMQFYIDHELYLELGEELPVHKDNPPIGGNYPLQLTCGHTRWSIHASWRDSEPLLRLQRGRPAMYMSREDAAARTIDDGQRVRVRNDVGSFEAEAMVSPAVRPGQVIVYHAWEPYQFPGWRSYSVLTPSPINPIQLAGGYYHIQPTFIVCEPGVSDRGTRVEVEPVVA